MKIVYTHVPTFLTQPHFNLDFMAYRLLIFVNLILSLSIIEMFIGQTPWMLSKFSILSVFTLYVDFLKIYWMATVTYYFKVISVII